MIQVCFCPIAGPGDENAAFQPVVNSLERRKTLQLQGIQVWRWYGSGLMYSGVMMLLLMITFIQPFLVEIVPVGCADGLIRYIVR